MESSEEDDDFPSIESITPQCKIDSLYQSRTEMGITKLCRELLDLKDAVENLCGNMRTKYLASLRISEAVVEMKHEPTEMQKDISSQGLLVQDLVTGVYSELEDWNKSGSLNGVAEENPQVCEEQDSTPSELRNKRMILLDNIDVLLAEHKVVEAVDALVAEERKTPELRGSADSLSEEANSYILAFLKRKATVEDQLVEPCVLRP